MRTSSATTAKPLPCSPARAASIAALSASRFVWPAIPVIVSTMPPICSDFAASSPIACVTEPVDSRTAFIASDASWAAATPSRAALRASSACEAVSCAERRASSTIFTWRSAPEATFETALAISPIARPAWSELAAICCDVLEKPAEAAWISPTIRRMLSARSANATPSTSRSEAGSKVVVRSPDATRRASVARRRR